MIKKISKKDPDNLIVGGVSIKRGESKSISLKVASLYDYTKLSIPLEVIRGGSAGPVLFISAAVHGDELNGVEIIKRILNKKVLSSINGTLFLIPVVNVFGFNNKSRYLPDRKDLNRSFPGSSKGSLASRLANIFMKEVVAKCSHGIDLHTGAIHRSNLPQIRASLDNPATKALAEGFGVPVIIDSKLRDGSLREAARKRKVLTLLFEGGEALRFNENVIKIGVAGCMSVMKNIGMLKITGGSKSNPSKKVFIAKESYWIRSPHSGISRFFKQIGSNVEEGELLAIISDTFGREKYEVIAEDNGILIGATLLPLVNQGDAMFHIATFRNTGKVKKAIDSHDDFTN